MRTGMALILAAGVGLAATAAKADVRLPAIFGDNMALQAGARVPVWGWADPGEEVTVSLLRTKATAKADGEGRWTTEIGPLKAGGPLQMTVAGKNSITVKNVLVGEVWLCSGQSNMGMQVRMAENAEKEITEAAYPKVRLFTVKMHAADEPQKDVEGQWVECSPQTAGSFSAAGYFFGRDLHKALGVPVGLINSSVGGTPAEAWTSKEKLESIPALRSISDRYAQALSAYPEAKKKHEQALAKWKEAAQKAKAEKRQPPRAPAGPPGPDSPHRPSCLYNGMIAPLIPFAIKGAIWYQGESNADRAEEYRTLFPALIADWRARWGEGSFPFLFAQLANFQKQQTDPNEASGWAALREAQLMTLKESRTGMAVLIDIGMADNIHPKNKQEAGRRLSLAARALAYGEKIEFSGPIYKSMRVEDGKIWLRFEHVDGGLRTKAGEPLRGFAVAGEDRKFAWAEARIEGEEVVVSSKDVPSPVSVRYAWADNPDCNLYNKEELPASPFRTDDWPLPAPPQAAGAKKTVASKAEPGRLKAIVALP